MANVLAKTPPQLDPEDMKKSISEMNTYLYYLYESTDYFLGQVQKNLDDIAGVNGRTANMVANLSVQIEELNRRVTAMGG